ncbi:MAG: DNA glycosylase [Clostridiales bacterium]|nr:DNA glycosylase [Clostridiales bacterium]
MRVVMPGFNLSLTARSGQCFRFVQLQDGAYHLVAHGHQLYLHDLGGGSFDLSCDQQTFDRLWHDYFDLGRNYDALEALGTGEDPYLASALRYARGMRILRQEPFETLMAFIISQRKSIPAITRCVSQLALRFGEQIAPGVHAFPTPGALARASDEDLAACGLGYRVPFISQSARLVHEGRIDLGALADLPDAQLAASLMTLPGVGVKVASCVMLFAYQRMDAFPVDVWIDRVLRQHYPTGFPFERYKGVAGILQQYLFCYARHQAGRAAGG